MDSPWGIVKHVTIILMCCLSLMVIGCEGTDTRNQVDDTVEELAGKKDLDRYQQMRDDLDDIQKRQSENDQQLKEASDTN